MDSEETPRNPDSGHFDFAAMRQKMVDQQLRPRGIRDPRVIEAMLAVPRERFVPQSERAASYEDGPLPIGFGQTISQPFTVAFMAEALHLKGDESVLEIGTGSGYGAAVLSRLCRQLHTIERIDKLAELARRRLLQLGFGNVTVHVGDGTLGLPAHAPFDGIVVTAGGADIPRPYIDQLRDGGRLVMPVGPTRRSQTLVRATKFGSSLVKENLGPFAFVPLVGQLGWHDEPE